MKKTCAAVFCLTFAAALAFCAPSRAETDWPKKTVELVCPYRAGGDSDVFLRSIAALLTKDLGVNVIVSNITGSGTLSAMRDVKAHAADGYKVLYYNSTLLAKQASGAMKDMSLTGDFVPAGSTAYDATYAVVVRAESGLKTMADLIARLKDKPKSVSFAISNKAATHYLMLSLQDAAGVQFNGIDAGSDNATRTLSLLSGEVDVILGNYANFKDYIADGQLVCLGIMAPSRNPAIPDVPTLKEQGFDVNYMKYYSYRFLNGTDPEIVAKFSAALKKASASAEFKKATDAYIAIANFQTPEEQQKYEEWAVNDQVKYWSALGK